MKKISNTTPYVEFHGDAAKTLIDAATQQRETHPEITGMGWRSRDQGDDFSLLVSVQGPGFAGIYREEQYGSGKWQAAMRVAKSGTGKVEEPLLDG